MYKEGSACRAQVNYHHSLLCVLYGFYLASDQRREEDWETASALETDEMTHILFGSVSQTFWTPLPILGYWAVAAAAAKSFSRVRLCATP